MDIFKMRDWMYSNKRKIRIASHVLLILTIINIAISMFLENFSLYLEFFIWTFIAQLIAFIFLQILFKEDEQ